MPIRSKLQETIINVENWRYDDLFGSYPEGARAKRAYFPPEDLNLEYINPKRRHLYKKSHKYYPDQFWGEVVAYQIGCLLDVVVPAAYAAEDKVNDDCAALIEWFYEDEKVTFTQGGSYMQQMIPEFDRKKGELHNFVYVEMLCKAYSEGHALEEKWIYRWADIFLFDALIGNTDRHQDNWGWMRYKGQQRWQIAPAFDNGTSLGYERWEEHVASWNAAQFEKYVNGGTHHIRWAKGDPKGCKHFELIQNVVALYPELKRYLFEKISGFDVVKLERILEHFRGFEIAIPLTQFRKDFYLKLTKIRQNHLIAILQ